MLIALLTAVCLVTYTFEIVFGLAGTILMLVIMTYFMDAKTLVIYSVLPQILVATIGLYRSPRNIDAATLGKMVAFAALGAALGIYLFEKIPIDPFRTLLAAAIAGFGLFLVVTPRRFQIPPLVARGMDVLAGASQALFGISGPIAMTRLLATFDDKLKVRNYALAFFLATNVFRLGGYLAHDTLTPDIERMMLISAPFLVITLWLTSHWHAKVNDALFRRVVSWAILAGGVVMLFQ